MILDDWTQHLYFSLLFKVFLLITIMKGIYAMIAAHI